MIKPSQDGKQDFKPYRLFNPVDPSWSGIAYADLAKPLLSASDDAAITEAATSITSTSGAITLGGPGYFQDGLVTSPGVAWANDFTSGRYRISAANFGESVSGVLTYDWNASRLKTAASYKLLMGIDTAGLPYGDEFFSCVQSFAGAVRASLRNTNTGTAAHSTYSLVNDEVNDVQLGIINTTYNHPVQAWEVAGAGFLLLSNAGGSGAGGTRPFYIGNNINGEVRFLSNSLVRMTIASTGLIGVNTSTPRRLTDFLDSSNPQLRLTHTDNVKYCDFQVDTNGDLTIAPSGGDVFITGAVSLSGFTSGSVLFAGTSGIVSQNNASLFWDNSSSSLTVKNSLGIGQAVSGASILGVLGTETIASGASATWDGINVITSNATLTGATNITTATGFNLVTIQAPNVNSASALTVTHSASLTIVGAPAGGGLGPTTITNPYSLWVQAGNARFAGQVLGKPGTGASPGYSIFGQTGDGMWSRTSTILNWSVNGSVMLELQTNVLMMNSNGLIGFNSSTVGTGSLDTGAQRDAAGVFKLGSSTNGVKIGYDGTNCKLVPSAGQLMFATAAKGTTDTTGYLTIPSCAGAPTGVPANIPTGQIPVVYDSTNDFLYIYNGGWKKSALYV